VVEDVVGDQSKRLWSGSSIQLNQELFDTISRHSLLHLVCLTCYC